MLNSLCRYLLAERRGLRRRVVELEAKLEAERERNRQREDDITSRWLTANGAYGIPSRQPTAARAKNTLKADSQPALLTALEEARLDAWRKAAVAVGRDEVEAEQMFYAQRHTSQLETYEPPAGMY